MTTFLNTIWICHNVGPLLYLIDHCLYWTEPLFNWHIHPLHVHSGIPCHVWYSFGSLLYRNKVSNWIYGEHFNIPWIDFMDTPALPRQLMQQAQQPKSWMLYSRKSEHPQFTHRTSWRFYASWWYVICCHTVLSGNSIYKTSLLSCRLSWICQILSMSGNIFTRHAMGHSYAMAECWKPVFQFCPQHISKAGMLWYLNILLLKILTTSYSLDHEKVMLLPFQLEHIFIFFLIIDIVNDASR